MSDELKWRLAEMLSDNIDWLECIKELVNEHHDES